MMKIKKTAIKRPDATEENPESVEVKNESRRDLMPYVKDNK